MDIYAVIATLSLVLQVIILFLLVGGVRFKARKKFRQHGTTMLVAVVLHTVTILAVMIPSFSAIITDGFSIVVSTIASVHGTLGILAEVIGVWIVASWRLRTSLQYCMPKKPLMRLTIILWSMVLILGLIIYLHFYTSVLSLP